MVIIESDTGMIMTPQAIVNCKNNTRTHFHVSYSNSNSNVYCRHKSP